MSGVSGIPVSFVNRGEVGQPGAESILPQLSATGEALAQPGLTVGHVQMLGEHDLDPQQLGRLAEVFDTAASMAEHQFDDGATAAVLRDLATTTLGKNNQYQAMSGFELIQLIMALSLKDGDRTRDMRQQLQPVMVATAIAVQAIASEAASNGFVGNLFNSVQPMLEGMKDIAIANASELKQPARDLTDNFTSPQSGGHEALAHVQETIMDTAGHYLNQTEQRFEGAVSLMDASGREISSEIDQLINNGNRIAMMVASAAAIYSGRA